MIETILIRISRVTIALAFSFVVWSVAIGPARADDRHGGGDRHSGHDHDRGGDWRQAERAYPDYYYAPPPNYYAAPEPEYYYPQDGYVPPQRSQGINLFFEGL
jgi:hypothetical protein